MTVYFDPANSRLVYATDSADEAYWDEHWAKRITVQDVRKPDRFVLSITREFLPKGARVVDAGCGMARTVFGLHHAGYTAHGVDYAAETVKAIKQCAPELDIVVGDARNMPFPDEHFDGLWSLGVIEHFFEGFDEIAKDTIRILKPGGYAFVTVPSMSPLRKLKARLGVYPRLKERPKDFYQFAMSSDDVVKGFAGLELVTIRNRGGFKGLKDEIGPLRAPLQKFYDSRFPAFRTIRAGMDKVLAPLTYHTRLYVFRKS